MQIHLHRSDIPVLIPLEVIEDKGLTLCGLGLYAYLASRDEDAQVTVDSLVTEGVQGDPHALRGLIHELTVAGYVVDSELQ